MFKTELKTDTLKKNLEDSAYTTTTIDKNQSKDFFAQKVTKHLDKTIKVQK
jgi:hypothetical protein